MCSSQKIYQIPKWLKKVENFNFFNYGFPIKIIKKLS